MNRLKEGRKNDAVVENMLYRYHSGFHVYICGRITPSDNPRTKTLPVLKNEPNK